MEEMILSVNTLPEPLFRLIKTDKVKVCETGGEIRIISFTETPAMERRFTIEESPEEVSRRQRAAMARFREAVRASGPLPPEYDEIMKERVNNEESISPTVHRLSAIDGIALGQ
jgi:hypothetical protein